MEVNGNQYSDDTIKNILAGNEVNSTMNMFRRDVYQMFISYRSMVFGSTCKKRGAYEVIAGLDTCDEVSDKGKAKQIIDYAIRLYGKVVM